MRYRWEGRLTVDVPEDWEVVEPGDLIEILPPDGTGALHISLYNRERTEPPTEAEARSLLEWFCRSKGGQPDFVIESRPDETRASCRFEILDDDDVVGWKAIAIVWIHRAVLATYNGELSTKAASRAEVVLESIRPDGSLVLEG